MRRLPSNARRGDIRLTVRSSHASAWNFAAPDTTAPSVTITSGVEGKTKKRKATFAFESDDSGATLQCKLDNGAFEPCELAFTTRKLAYGKHTFQVYATDSTGNEGDPVKRKFKVVHK